MPRIWYEDGYRFSFYSADRGEPPHVHVFGGGGMAKWWLDPVEEAGSNGFKASDRAAIRRIIQKRQGLMLDAWNRNFPEGR